MLHHRQPAIAETALIGLAGDIVKIDLFEFLTVKYPDYNKDELENIADLLVKSRIKKEDVEFIDIVFNLNLILQIINFFNVLRKYRAAISK